MSRKFIAFDIETAKEVPGADFNWKPHRPLGISCIASHRSDAAEPRLWWTKTADGTPAATMGRDDVAAFIRHLREAVADGYMPLSWNGLSFDFDVLAEESSLTDDCRRLAVIHVDMMFHVVCEKGFPVSLSNAAAGLGLAGKLQGVDGYQAPILWANGQFETVMKYVAQDVRTTLDVAATASKKKAFAWKTRKGTVSRMPLSGGWLTVEEAFRLPLPDTSWMNNAPTRASFAKWLGKDLLAKLG